jgi:hypothetical protein
MGLSGRSGANLSECAERPRVAHTRTPILAHEQNKMRRKWSRVRPAEIDSTWELKIQYTNEILIEFSFL